MGRSRPSLLCEEPHQPSPVRALGGSPQVLPRGDKPGSLTARASLVALPVTWDPRRVCLSACVSLRPLTIRDSPLTTWPGSQLLQVWKRDQYMPGMGSCGVRTDKPEGAEAGGLGAVGSLWTHPGDRPRGSSPARLCGPGDPGLPVRGGGRGWDRAPAHRGSWQSSW